MCVYLREWQQWPCLLLRVCVDESVIPLYTTTILTDSSLIYGDYGHSFCHRHPSCKRIRRRRHGRRPPSPRLLGAAREWHSSCDDRER